MRAVSTYADFRIHWSRCRIRQAGRERWKFSPDDSDELASPFACLASLSDVGHKLIGSDSQQIVANWAVFDFAQAYGMPFGPPLSVPRLLRLCRTFCFSPRGKGR